MVVGEAKGLVVPSIVSVLVSRAKVAKLGPLLRLP